MKTTIKLTIITLLFSIGLDDIKAQMATNDYAEEETDSIKTYNVFQDPNLKSTA